MIVHRLIIPLIVVSLSCNSKDHYSINCCEDGPYKVDHKGILYLVESCNYQSLQSLKDTQKLKQYLSADEMKKAFDIRVIIQENDTFHQFENELVPWVSLFSTDKFTAEVVLLLNNTYGRGYFFQVRTYDKERNLISIQDFATWDDENERFCSGDFSRSARTFKVICGDEESEYKFDEEGRIVSID